MYIIHEFTNYGLYKKGSGVLPNDKCVMYAVFPCWNNYKPMTRSNLKTCTEYLRRTIIDCLQLAEDRNIESIAFPPISSGSPSFLFTKFPILKFQINFYVKHLHEYIYYILINDEHQFLYYMYIFYI